MWISHANIFSTLKTKTCTCMVVLNVPALTVSADSVRAYDTVIARDIPRIRK